MPAAKAFAHILQHYLVISVLTSRWQQSTSKVCVVQSSHLRAEECADSQCSSQMLKQALCAHDTQLSSGTERSRPSAWQTKRLFITTDTMKNVPTKRHLFLKRDNPFERVLSRYSQRKISHDISKSRRMTLIHHVHKWARLKFPE